MAHTRSKAEIEETVKRLIHEQLNVDLDEIRPDAHFVDDFGADSLDLTELVIAIEDEFEINVPESQIDKLTTVSSIVEHVHQHFAAQEGSNQHV